MKLLSADNEIYQSRKPTTQKQKEALTIKDLGVEVSPEGSEAIRDYVYLKSGSSDAIKNLLAERGRRKIGFKSKQKEIREFVEEGIKDMKKDK